MTEIKEFQPLVYNLEKLNKLKIDFKDVVCPPYDVISPQQHRVLLRKKYNFVNLELPKGTTNKKYGNAKKILSLWKKNKVVVKEEIPSVYIYQQVFEYPKNSGKFYTRYGMFCLVKADPEYKTILPHELTKPKPLEDRTKLLNTIGVQTSAPFFVVEDEEKKFFELLKKLAKEKYKIISFTDEENIQHSLYRIVKGIKELEEIKKFLQKKFLIIADGHHRYKVTIEYLKKIKHKFLMGYICSSSDEGLLILPTHRALPEIHIYEELKKYFEFVEWDGKSEVKILFYKNGEFKVMKPKLKKFVKEQPYFLLDKILCELEGEQIRQQMFYHQEMKEVINFADKFNGCAFILPPVGKDEFVKIVKERKVFPPKSTYFYPKVMSGLMFYDFS
jgi:uncharacterized protein (DUF1015 family)